MSASGGGALRSALAMLVVVATQRYDAVLNLLNAMVLSRRNATRIIED